MFYILNVSMDMLKMRNIGFCWDFYFHTLCHNDFYFSSYTDSLPIRRFSFIKTNNCVYFISRLFLYIVFFIITYPWRQDHKVSFKIAFGNMCTGKRNKISDCHRTGSISQSSIKLSTVNRIPRTTTEWSAEVF